MEPKITKTPLRQRLPSWAKVLLQLVSFVLFLSLTSNLLGLMLTADLRQIAAKDGLSALVNSVFTTYFEQLQSPKAGRSGQAAEDTTLDFSDPESLTDWAYGLMQEAFPDSANIQKESVQTFLAESTLKNHLADKLTGSVVSLLETGTVEDLFTGQELAALIEENRDLIAREFGVPLTEDTIATIASSIDATLQAQDINGKFRSFVESFTKGDTPILFGITAQDVLSFLTDRLTGDAFFTQLVTCLALAALLCLANFYNIPAGLTWAAFPCLISGGLMALATGLLGLIGSLGAVMETIQALVAPVHNTVLAIGGALLVISIAWRILRTAIAKRAVSF